MKIETESIEPKKPAGNISSFNSRFVSFAEEFDQLTSKRQSELSGKVLREFKIILRNMSWAKWDMLAKTFFADSAEAISAAFGQPISETRRIREETPSKADASSDADKDKDKEPRAKKGRKLSRNSLSLLSKCLLAVDLLRTNQTASKCLFMELLFGAGSELENKPELENLSGYLLYRFLNAFTGAVSQEFLMVRLREYQIQKAHTLVGIVYNHLLRGMLLNNYIEEAGHFLTNCDFPEHEQNTQLCKFLFYKGYYKGLVGDFTQSRLLLSQVLRKAPESHLQSESRALKNFKLLTQKHLIVVSLLLSEMPSPDLFRESRLNEYKTLVLLVSKGHFKNFREHLEKCQAQFRRDLVFPLLLKLKSVVLKNGLKKLSQAYSSLSVPELLFKLGLHNERKLQVDAFLAKVMSKMSRFTLDSNLKTVVFQREERTFSDDSIRKALAKRIEHIKSLEEQMVHALKFPEEKEEVEVKEESQEDELDLEDLDFSFEDFF